MDILSYALGYIKGKAQGGGNNVVSASGKYTAITTGENKITHNLNAIPDLIIVRPEHNQDGSFVYWTGKSSEFATGSDIQYGILNNENPTEASSGLGIGELKIDELGVISGTTPKTFKIGGTLIKHVAGVNYEWEVIGGLAQHAAYICLTLELDGQGNLIVLGGAPEIEQLEIFVDGESVAIVDYVYGETFITDISEYVDDVNKHTVSVVATGERLSEVYPNVYYEEVYGNINPPPIYGVSGLYSSTAALTRTDDAVGLTYTVNSSGSITSDFNNIFPWSEAKLVSDSAGNQFVQMPEMWFRVGADDSNRITDIAVSSSKHPEGNWYKVESFCYGRYGGAVSDEKLLSKSGYTRQASALRDQFRCWATNNGLNYHQLDLYHKTVMNFLWFIEFATKDSMSIMTGHISGSACKTGRTDSVSTPSGYETTYAQMRFHYIEDFIGNLMEWVDGVYASGAGSSYADYVTSNIDDYSDFTTNKTQTIYKNSVNGCISALGWDADKPFLCMPTEAVTNKNYDTYFCDYIYRKNGDTAIYAGAAYNGSTTYNGIAYYYACSYLSTYASIGGRLMYRGILG